MMKTNPLQYLPHELIIQILLRLPVTSLLRFKCVCKLWLTLISDIHFANSHFQITAATHTHRILFISYSATHETRSIDFEASLHDNSACVSPNLNFMYSQQPYFSLNIKGSCGGFIVLHCFVGLIYLWNPSTGLHKRISLSPINFKGKIFRHLYGFGYDQSRDDYLLVSMSYHDTNNLDNISSHLELFSLRDNMWKKIEGNHFLYMDRNKWDDPIAGTFFNRAIHWLAFRHDISMNLIVAFDLMEKKLLDIHLPNDFCCKSYHCDLWVFGDSLSLWGMGDGAVEIWVMKEYKVNSSWTKTLFLPIDGIPSRYFSPLCCTKSGDIVGTDGSMGLMKYDDKGQLLEHHIYCNDPCESLAIMYTESLLSVPTLLIEFKKMTQTIKTRRRSTRRMRL
ncbi:unnamed protein product [Trifolium pratense]|uniref:Uncharacterized protein n=1 Tax=Trifolium pratense TaxID=57577 RepID=A0ACB0IPQ7_TRIPR|nr:unnamed protein product [Trifolium pratense]